MTAFFDWINANFTLVQSAGIIGSILLTAAALRRDKKSRRIGDLLTLSAQHHELWSDMLHRADLARVASAEVDLVAKPLSVPEQEFMQLVIVHFFVWWLLAKDARVVSLKVLRIDAASFFRLPIPRAVWEQTKSTRDPAFVHFIDGSIAPTVSGWRKRLSSCFGKLPQ